MYDKTDLADLKRTSSANCDINFTMEEIVGVLNYGTDESLRKYFRKHGGSDTATEGLFCQIFAQMLGFNEWPTYGDTHIDFDKFFTNIKAAAKVAGYDVK